MSATVRYVNKMRDKLEKYTLRYPESAKLIALKLLWLNLKFLLSPTGITSCFNDDKQHIAVVLKGGIGDFVIAGKYLKALSVYLGESSEITVMGKNSDLEALKTIFQKQTYVHEVLPQNYYRRYDLALELVRFPVVLSYTSRRLTEKTLKYVRTVENFCLQGTDLLRNDFLGRVWSLQKGRTRENQADIDNLLGLDKTQFELQTSGNLPELAEKFGFDANNFITVQTGGGKCFAGIRGEVRQWSAKNWAELVKALKTNYPATAVLQLGAAEQEKICGVDADLRGKTTLDECLTLLKAAKLHVSQEGGMTIMRHFLRGGKSVVLFGPTDEEFFGFAENENICCRKCPCCCEWLTPDWMKKCVKTGGAAECLELLTPEEVMNTIRKSGAVK